MAEKLETDPTSSADRAGEDYRTVVGVDDSDGSINALRWAARRADRFGPIRPLVAWHTPWWAASSVPLVDEFAAEAGRVGDLTVERVPGADVGPTIVVQGNAGPAIVAAGASADLIVVGTRGRGAVADAMLGSVSSYVVANATTPVAVVPPSAEVDFLETKVVVGVDGSDHSIAAAVWAVNNTPPTAAIELVHCWVYQSLVEMDFSGQAREEFEEKARTALNMTIRRVSEQITAEDHERLVGVLERGDARTVLAERAADADLLVIGARGRGGLRHLLLGSVTSSLLHQPVTTTVVIPGRSGDSTQAAN